MSKLTGGKMLAQLNRKNPNLGALISKLIAAHNHIAAQIGVDPVGQAAAPPPPQGVEVIVTGEQANIRVVDNNPTNRARTYFSEVHTDAQFSSPKMVVQHGATRDAQVLLPTFDAAGAMQAYHIRTYSQTAGSPPSPTVAYPTYVTMAGTTSGDLPASAGSGTSPATGTVSAQGYGEFPTRNATKSNTAVYTGGGGGGGVGGVTQIVAGSNVTISPPDGTGIVTVNSTSGGITQLTGDVTAGPGSGSQATTLKVAVAGWDVFDGSAGTNLGNIQSMLRDTRLSECFLTVTASDATTDLTFDIQQNGVSIFTSPPTITHGATMGQQFSFPLKTVPLPVAKNDKFNLNISAGTSSWKVSLVVR